MNKKKAVTKVLISLENGFSIREVREFHTDVKTNKTIQVSSTVAVFLGNKIFQDGFKNSQEALKYYRTER